MNQQALIEAMAKAICDEAEGKAGAHTYSPYMDRYANQARAALTAYAEASGERVVVENDTGKTMGFAAINEGGGVISGPFTLEPGHELVARKAGTNGK